MVSPPLTPITRFELYDQDVTTTQNQFSQEIQLSGKPMMTGSSYLLGGHYFRVERRAGARAALCADQRPIGHSFTPCNTWTQGNDQETRSTAVFGQARYELVPDFSVTVGGRYTWRKGYRLKPVL